MKPSIELYKLIKSLTKSEKRFFKLSSALQSGDKNYVKIFDFIDAQKEYDEEALKEEFKDETFIKHLSSEKNHLYKLILKSLRSYYSEESLSSILKQEIKNIEILYNKALYRECEKFIVRAKKIAQDTEKFYYWNEIISWEKKLREEGLQENINDEGLDLLIKEEEVVIDKLRNLAEYQVIYSKINNVFRSGGFIRSEKEEQQVEEIANYHLIKGKNTAISTRASSICYYIKGLCAATNRNFSDSYLFFNKTREILDRSPNIRADLSTRYVQTITHLLRCYIDGEQFEQAQQLCVELRGLSGKKGFNNINTEVRILANAYQMELILLQRQGLFQESIELIEKLDGFIAEHIDILSKEQQVLFTYYKSVSYFAVGEYKKTLQFLNEVLNDNEQMIRQDIYSFARIFNLVLHFELGNYDFTEYVIKSVNRYLSKHGRDYATENLLIKNIRKLSKNILPEEQQQIFQALHEELAELFKDHHECVILEYFNLTAWVQSKLDKTTYSEEVVHLLKANSSANHN
jgi:hypothetical protein